VTLYSAENWGSAVCVYWLSDIDRVFDDGSWVEQRRLESAWLRVHDVDVPTPRPAQVPPAHCWRRGVVVSGVRRMNEVNARRARLVPGWVTVFGRVYHRGM